MPKTKTTRKSPSGKQTAPPAAALVPQKIAPRVQLIRGERVLLDADLAELYGVPTGELNRAVRRNLSRFPKDFMFQLTREEWKNLECQSGISSSEATEQKGQANPSRQSKGTGHGGRRTPPYAFTEQGVAMLSSVLHSPRAIEVNIAIMRTFVQLRHLMDNNRLLAEKIEKLEAKYEEHDNHFQTVFEAIRQLISEEEKPKRRIGFNQS